MAVLEFVVGGVAGAGLAWMVLVGRHRKPQAPSTDTSGELKRQQAEITELRSRLAAAETARARAQAGSGPASAKPAAPKATATPADDLTRIKGIGPVLAKKLQAMGINSFRQIADFTPADIQRITETLNVRGRVDQWVEQARALAGK